MGSSYEECRAECVGIYLSTERKVLTIFGHESKEEQEDLVYINWLSMVRAGLCALELYTPEQKKWRQAHMQARYAILQVLLEAGQGLVTLTESEDGKNVTGRDERHSCLQYFLFSYFLVVCSFAGSFKNSVSWKACHWSVSAKYPSK